MRGQQIDPVKKLIQGQVPTVLTASREDMHDGTVIFRVGGRFLITASVHGVAFAGSSPNFKTPLVNDLHKIIRWADRCASDLATDRSAPLQDELLMKLRLRTKRYASGTFKAWYEGHFDDGVTGATANAAVKLLRYKWRTGENGRLSTTRQLQE